MGKIIGRKGFILIIVCFILLIFLLSLYITISGRKNETISTKGVDKKTFPKNPVQNAPEPYLDILAEINIGKNRNIVQVSHTVYSGTGLILVDKNNVFISWLPESELIYNRGKAEKSLGDVMNWWVFEDIDKNNNPELAVQSVFVGTAGVHPFYLYTYQNGEFTLLLKLIEAKSKAEVIDLDNDGIKEVVYKYALSGSGNRERETLRWKDIWRIEDGKPVKVNNQFPDEYKELIPIYDKALTTQYNKDFYEFDYPVYRCLKEKAELNINGQFVDAESCKGILRNKNKK